MCPNICTRKGILKLFRQDTIASHYDGERQFLSHIHRHFTYAVNYYFEAGYENAQNKVDKLKQDSDTAVEDMQTELA